MSGTAPQVSSSEDGGPGQVESLEFYSSSSSGEESAGDSVFRLEDIEQLLKSVRATMELEEPNLEKTVEDLMF